MKSLLAYIFLLLFPLGCAGQATSPQNIPGLKFLKTSFELEGRMLFTANWNVDTAQLIHGKTIVYEYDISQGKLHKIVDVPGIGLFNCAKDGQTFLVLHGWTPTRQYQQFTKAFVYSSLKKKGSIIDLSKLVDTVTEYRVDERNVIIKNGFGSAANVQVYDSEGSRIDPQQATSFEDIDKETHTGFKTTNGHYIMFEGRNAPLYGYKLVSSPYDRIQTTIQNNVKNVKMLKHFSELKKDYFLCGLSPSTRYALVLYKESIPRSVKGGETRTYYIVNVISGKTQKILEDAFEEEIKAGEASRVYWTKQGPTRK